MTLMPDNFKPSIGSKVGLFLLYFLYLFSLQFIFMPSGLGSRAIMGLAGVVYLIVVKFDWVTDAIRGQRILVNKRQFAIIVSMTMFFLVSVTTNLINETSESNFLTYPLSIIMIFAAAFMIADITRRVYHRLNFPIIANYLIAITLAQVYIALAMLFAPEVKVMLGNLVVADKILLNELLDEDGFRLMGLGIQFFGAGIINSVMLMLIAMLFRRDCTTLRRAFYLTFAFVSIFALGMMMSRTTLIGVGMAFGLLALGIKIRSGSGKNLRRVLVSILGITAIVVMFFGFLSKDNQKTISVASEYGFEMFVNYFESGESTTASTDQLRDMYDIYPTKIGTWVIGDGWYVNPDNADAYYMGTDVGFIRLIFYCGVIGLIIYFYYQRSVLVLINYNTGRQYAQLWFFIFIFVIIANLKGFIDIVSIVAIFMFLTTNTSKNNV